MVLTSTLERDNNAYQLGLKAGHSVSSFVGVIKRTVAYYVNRGSHVFKYQ